MITHPVRNILLLLCTIQSLPVVVAEVAVLDHEIAHVPCHEGNLESFRIQILYRYSVTVPDKDSHAGEFIRTRWIIASVDRSIAEVDHNVVSFDNDGCFVHVSGRTKIVNRLGNLRGFVNLHSCCERNALTNGCDRCEKTNNNENSFYHQIPFTLKLAINQLPKVRPHTPGLDRKSTGLNSSH